MNEVRAAMQPFIFQEFSYGRIFEGRGDNEDPRDTR